MSKLTMLLAFVFLVIVVPCMLWSLLGVHGGLAAILSLVIWHAWSNVFEDDD